MYARAGQQLDPMVAPPPQAFTLLHTLPRPDKDTTVAGPDSPVLKERGRRARALGWDSFISVATAATLHHLYRELTQQRPPRRLYFE